MDVRLESLIHLSGKWRNQKSWTRQLLGMGEGSLAADRESSCSSFEISLVSLENVFLSFLLFLFGSLPATLVLPIYLCLNPILLPSDLVLSLLKPLTLLPPLFHSSDRTSNSAEQMTMFYCQLHVLEFQVPNSYF